MSSEFIGNDYTINFYEHNSKAQTTLKKQITYTTESVTESTQVDKLDYFEYANSTGSTPVNNILFGDTNLDSRFISGIYNDPFARSAFISGTTAALGWQPNSDSETMTGPYPGVLIVNSGSSGWVVKQLITASLSDMVEEADGPSGTIGGGDPQVDDFGRNWSYDRKNGRHVVICQPGIHGSYYHADKLNGKVFIFTSGASGFELVQTITTASLPTSIRNHFNSTNADSDGQYYTNGYHMWCGTARIDGDNLTVGTLVRNEVPESEFDYPTQILNGSDAFAPSPGVVAFKSSSAGFVFEKFLDGYDIQYEGVVNSTYNLDGNITHDLQHGVCVFGGNGGWGTGGWAGHNGRMRIWKSGSSGWVNEGAHDLYTLGLTGSHWISTDASVEGNFSQLPHWAGGAGAGQRPEYAFWSKFARIGLAVHKNHIVAAAVSREFGWYASGIDKIYTNAIFIIKSSSDGWNLEKRIKTPNPDSYGSSADAYDDRFGQGGLAISEGTIVVKSNAFKQGGGTTGRAYIYKSSSDSGWDLSLTVENPYYGNSTYPIDEYGSSREKFGRGLGSTAGFYVDQTMPGVGGDGDKQFVIIPMGDQKNLSGDASQGAVYILEGSASYKQITVETTTTKTITNTTYVTSNAPAPFRFSTNYYRAELDPKK